MRSRPFLLLVASLVEAGCDGVTTVSELPTTVTLQVGDEIRLPDQNLRFVMEEVVEDSRCPENVVCVWEGTVVVRFLVTRPDSPDEVLTEILVDTQQFQIVERVRLRVTAASPARLAGVQIDQDDYRISLAIEEILGTL